MPFPTKVCVTQRGSEGEKRKIKCASIHWKGWEQIWREIYRWRINRKKRRNKDEENMLCIKKSEKRKRMEVAEKESHKITK